MTRRFKRAEGMVERRIGNEHILVPIRGDVADLDSLYTLDEVSAFIFRKAAEGLPEDQIVEHLTREFDVDQATARKDAQRILTELVAVTALTEVPATR